MSNKIANGAELTRQSWSALRQNRQLLVFPLISGIVMVLVATVFLAAALGMGVLAGFGGSEGEQGGSWLLGLLLLFLFYLVSYTVVIFSNTALVATVLRLSRGEPATVGDGISMAFARIGKILVYALISATVGVIASSIARSGRESDNILVAIVAAVIGGAIQGAWSLLVFFAIPVMVAEDLGVVPSLKRSLAIFKQTWGEGFVGRTAIGGASCLAYLAIIVVVGVVIGIGVATGVTAVIALGIALAVVLVGALVLVTGAVNGVFQASLYRYATTGDAGPFIKTQDAASAFAA